jgi:hypothetical protein
MNKNSQVSSAEKISLPSVSRQATFFATGVLAGAASLPVETAFLSLVQKQDHTASIRHLRSSFAPVLAHTGVRKTGVFLERIVHLLHCRHCAFYNSGIESPCPDEVRYTVVVVRIFDVYVTARVIELKLKIIIFEEPSIPRADLYTFIFKRTDILPARLRI